MPDEIDLSPEDEEALERAWAAISEEARQEELGEGPPRWGLERARYERPHLSQAELGEWVWCANEEYRKLRLQGVARSEADRLSLLAANQRFPTS